MGVMVAMGVIMMVIFMRVVVVIMLVMAVVIMVVLVFMGMVIIMRMVVMLILMGVIVVTLVVGVIMIVRMVIMGVIIVVVMLMLMVMLVIAMRMRLEQRAFPELQQGHPIGIQKRRHGRARGQRFNRIFHPRGQVRPNPEHKIGVLQRRSLRGAQVVLMRRCTLLDHQIRGADTFHDAGNQGMNRRDIDSDVGHVGKGGSTHQNRDGREGNEFRGHLGPYVIL